MAKTDMRHLADKMIDFIDSNLQDGKPFFGYLPFMAVHSARAGTSEVHRPLNRSLRFWLGHSK
ncbi:MAG: hypothetical protein ACJAYE_001747 [Candidatus Azotimanducaceae bacterium]|jgi:hypothetical protein